MRPQLSDAEKRNGRLTVRFRSDEITELTSQAEYCGLSVSELIRRRAMQKRVVPATDLKMLSELRRMGGLLKHLHNESNGLYSRETAGLLSELHAATTRVGREREGEQA
ncbi:mobilization protein [Synergistales bacterium]|nr:mobilization protein [Synergistales bacterium]